MKQLKLEVGKTYRSREGEEVKIVRMGNRGWDYWNGSNGEWYYEGGKWSYVAEEHPKDLIEEVTGTRHTFKIPNGTKEVTVEQVGNRIVVEMVPEGPKPGDVMVNQFDSVYIFKGAKSNNRHDYFAGVGRSGQIVYDNATNPGRPATPEEAQPLWDALKKAGKRWNQETLEVEEVPEPDRIREWVGENIEYRHYTKEVIAEVIEAYLKHREGEK